jgi:pyruvate/2-oxoglutarate dehydrogenase complex dihydrolipoamide acyltransferase (E2) component
MPDTGEAGGATLVLWLRQTGDEIEAEEPICLVRIGDLEAEVVSPAPGILASVLADPGMAVASGTSLATVAIPAPPIDERPEPESMPEPEVEAMPDPLPEAEVEPEPEPEPEPVSLPEPPPVDLRSFRSPAVRRLLVERGVVADAVEGTGRDGRVTARDVARARQ